MNYEFKKIMLKRDIMQDDNEDEGTSIRISPLKKENK